MHTSGEIETLCGIGHFRPRFLQKLASKKTYVFLYGCLGIIQSMMGTYLGAMISTFEKRFGLKSRESAILISVNEIAHVAFLFILPFGIKVKRRPLWIAVALFVSAMGCFMMGLPYLITEHQYVDIYDEERHAIKSSSLKAIGHSSVGSIRVASEMCGSRVHPDSLEKLCDVDGERKLDYIGFSLLVFGILLTGIGNCVHETFGLPYLDDNVSHEKTPIWMALVIMFKMNVGPALGFILAGACLKIYDDPSKSPGFDDTDPKWIGAWWIGPPFIGLLIILFSFPLILFPQRLPKPNTDSALEKEKSEESEFVPNKAEFKTSMLRLLKNRLFIYNFFSNLFYAFGFKGLRVFFQKYIESQFQKTASKAALIGAGSVFASGIGIITSGFALSIFKPRTRVIAGWNVFAMTLIVMWTVVFGIIGCQAPAIHGEKADKSINLNATCNSECDCPISRPEPICSRNGKTSFYSPCAAGCKGPMKTRFDHVKKKNLLIYTECSCAVDVMDEEYQSQNLMPFHKSWVIKEYLHRDEAVKGWCEFDCGLEWRLFVGSAITVGFIASSVRIGNKLVTMR